MARQTQFLPLPFGAGLDRATGDIAIEPRSAEVARNLILRDRKYQIRPGLGTNTADLNTVTSSGPVNQFSNVTCHVAHYVAASVLVWIGYETSTGKVRLYTTNLTGGNPTWIALLTTLDANLADPPIFHTAESDGILLIAHDQADVTKRMATVYWDKVASGSPTVLQANLDGVGAADVKFRGVYAYKGWMFGWGFGTNTDKDRPEILRVSKPGDPVTWLANHYFMVGVRMNAIVSVATGQNVLVIFKGGSWYRLTGTDRSNWSVEIGETQFGCWFPRGAISLNGMVYFYSQEGPRITTGLEPSVDISSPVDLDAPTLVPSVSAPSQKLGWTTYVPYQREIWWGFPYRGEAAGEGTTQVLALSLRQTQEASRWTTHVLEKPILCAAYRDASEPAVEIDPGEVASITVSGIVGYHATDPFATSAGVHNEISVAWTYNSVTVGDETVEIWMKGDSYPDADEGYFKIWEGQIEKTTGDSRRLTNLARLPYYASIDTCTIAIRLRRRGKYKSTYTSTDPASWPSGARQTFTPFIMPEVTALTWDSIKPEPNFYAFSSGGNNWVEAYPNWKVELSFTRTTFTRPGAITAVSSLYRIPGINSNETKLAWGYTWTTANSPAPVLQTLEAMGSGTDATASFSAKTFVINKRAMLLRDGHTIDGYMGPAGTFSDAGLCVAATYVSPVGSVSGTYYGKAKKVSLELYATTGSFTNPSNFSDTPTLNSLGYSWSSPAEFGNLTVNATFLDSEEAGTYPNNGTVTAGADPSHVDAEVSTWQPGDAEISVLEQLPLLYSTVSQRHSHMTNVSGEARITAAIRRLFRYTPVTPAAPLGSVYSAFYAGPWLNKQQYNTLWVYPGYTVTKQQATALAEAKAYQPTVVQS